MHVSRQPFVLKPHDCGGFVAGVDPTKLNQLIDKLEVENVILPLRRGTGD